MRPISLNRTLTLIGQNSRIPVEMPSKSKEKLCSTSSISQSSEIDKPKSRLKCLPWILLTLGVGLCIIGFGIYIILRLNSRDNVDILDRELELDAGLSRELEDNGNFKFKLEPFSNISEDLEIPQNAKGCIEKACRLDCYSNENLYSDVAFAMNQSRCEQITSMMISNQVNRNIADLWIDSTALVLKVVIMNSKITKISTAAFSSSMFAKVFHMTWVNLQLTELSNGALLGLYALKKLEIDFKLPEISMSFLQPVQLTLTHLRMNAGITFEGNSNAFDNIYLGKLYHLDLSHNNFRGALSKRIFSGTPNITYLYLTYCFITSIEDTAFEDIADKLVLVDLKHNLLTQIGELVFGIASRRVLMDLDPNNWNCDCELRSMLSYFKDNKNLFVSTPYCRYPFHLYGKTFDELQDNELNCESSTIIAPPDPTSRVTADWNHDDQEMLSDDTFSGHDSTEAPTKPSPMGAILQFSCSEALDYDLSGIKDDSEVKAYSSGTFVFEPPEYDLILELFDNYSVRASIDEYKSSEQLNIIWFSDGEASLERNSIRNASQTDYTCMQYEEPYLIVDPLQQNRTYTFCMMPMDNLVISPLFCQPLHVPAARNHSESEDVWIPESDKQFTIAMLCLIFFISTVFGAIFAYLGIKSFPNLLEGSKNVVVVKELDKECRVSTITDTKNCKPPLSFKQNRTENSFKLRHKKSLEASAQIYDTNLPSLLNLGTPSTLLEEPFGNTDFQSIGYEMPKQFKKEGKESISTISMGVDRPHSPPPLPKRNSNVSELLDPKLKA